VHLHPFFWAVDSSHKLTGAQSFLETSGASHLVTRLHTTEEGGTQGASSFGKHNYYKGTLQKLPLATLVSSLAARPHTIRYLNRRW
jgi:hypothetical protein